MITTKTNRIAASDSLSQERLSRNWSKAMNIGTSVSKRLPEIENRRTSLGLGINDNIFSVLKEVWDKITHSAPQIPGLLFLLQVFVEEGNHFCQVGGGAELAAAVSGTFE